MEQAEINIKQERDFGDIFNVTFAFIGQEFKRLGSAILYYVLPVFLVVGVLNVLLSFKQNEIMQNAMGGYYGTDPFEIFSGAYFLVIFTMLILYAVGYTVLKCTVYGYMKLYAEKGRDGFDLSDVRAQIAKYFFPILGTAIAVGFIAGIGFMFCIIPGIYLGVSLSIIYMALLFEDKGFGSAFSRSFELTKERWWLTLGLIVVTYIIVYVISLLLQIPAMIAGLKPLFSNMKNLEALENFSFSTTYIILSSITTTITYLLTILPALILAFHYFSLVEIKEKPSLQDKIDQINE